jgi:sugar O-acyltransferase (sialic acid O-acetyltransferase NeuD family)
MQVGLGAVVSASTVAAKPRLFVYGAGGHAKIVVETIKRQGRFVVIALLDDDVSKRGRELLGIQVLGGPEMLSQLRAAGVELCFVAIGDNHVRRQKTEQLVRMGFQAANVIDPTAIVLSRTCVGAGTLTLCYSYVGVDSTLGQGCILSVNCTVGHDCVLGDYVHLTPGVRLGGNVHIGAESFLGLGATVLPGVHIGQRVTVGAGSAVTGDLPDGVVATGVPAKILRSDLGEESTSA